jgi:rhamnosyltransferase subunit B
VIGAHNIHFVVMAIGSAGDLFPMRKLALALRERGQGISFLGPEQHRPFVEGAGLPFRGVPVDEAVLDDPRLWDPRHGFGVVWRATRGAAADLMAYVASLPAQDRCVLLVHPLALLEADLCRAARPDIRIAAVYLAPSNLPTIYDPLVIGPVRVPAWVPFAVRRWLWRRIGDKLIDPVVLPDLNSRRGAQGLPPVRSALRFMVAVPDLSLAMFPSWFGPAQPDWPRPLLHGGFPLFDPDPQAAFSPALVQFLADGEAPIVFTPGTGNRQAAAFFRAAALATGSLRRRAIFLTHHEAQLPADLPPSILWQPYIPLQKLLPEAAALVHHGGIGTTAEALRSGVSQLVIPFAHDQFDNAARVKALGVGLSLPAAQLSAVRLTHRLRRLLSSRTIAVKSRALASRFGPNSNFAILCDTLVSLPM